MKHHQAKYSGTSPAFFLTFLSLGIMIVGLITGRMIVQHPALLDTRAKTSTQASDPTPTPRPSSGNLSNSKLGIFMIGNYSTGAQQIVAAGPRVIKVLDPQSNESLMGAVRQYKQLFPNGTVIMRVYVPQSIQYSLSQNPEDAATDFWELHVKPEVNKLSASDKALIDYLNGPNYNENFMANTLENDEELGWYNRFWIKYIDLVAQYGMKTNMGEIYVAGLDKIHIPKIIGALQKLKEKNGIWSYHGYTIQYTMDPAVEKDYSLHYREFYDYLRSEHPELADLKMALTEAGVDKAGNPNTDGWQQRGTPEQYEDWLKWFDTEMRKDSYIIGATLFEIGDSGWKSFNIEPIAPWLAQYLRGQGGSTTGTPPPNTTTTPPGGRNGTTTLRVEVWVTRTGQTRRLWNASDGTGVVYIKGPTERGADRFSVVMNVPTSTGVFQDTEGHYFRGEPGVVLWAGAGTSANDPGGGTTPGRYTTKMSSLPSNLGPIPYPNVYATVSQGQTGVAILDVVEGQVNITGTPTPSVTPSVSGTPPPPTATPTPTPGGNGNLSTGYTNADYQRIITQYGDGALSALEVSQWITDATRSPGLQLSTCDPTIPGDCGTP